MGPARAGLASCMVQLRLRFSPIRLGLNLLESVPITITYAWLAIQSNNSDLLTHILVGAPMIAVWATMSLQLGQLLDSEIWNRTLIFVLISRTAIPVVMLGRMLGEVIMHIPTAILSVSIVLILAPQIPSIASPGFFALSVVVAVISLVSTTMIFAPFVVMVRGRAGFMSIFILAGIVLGGFLYPIDRLPMAFGIVSRVLPTSWAMSSVWESVGGVSRWSSIALKWATSLLMSLTYLVSSYLLFKVIRKRITVSGTLGES